ncbi:MAG: WD40 repeat domain-containing protein [Bacteroidota bacterium]
MAMIHVDKIATLAGHKDCIYTLANAKNTQFFYSAGGDGLVARWDLSNPEIGKMVAKVPNSIYAICLLPENNQLLVGQNYEGIHLIDLTENKEINSMKISDAAIFDIQARAQEAFIGLGDGVLIVVDLASWSIKRHVKTSEKSLRTIALHPRKPEVALGFSDNYIRVFSTETWQPITQVEAHTNSVFTLQYSPNGDFLLSGSRDAHLKVWETEQYQLHESIVAHMYAINRIAYHPKGQYFVTGSMDKAVKVWDAHSFRLLKVIDKGRHAGHGTSVNSVLWSPYEDYVLSASDDRTVSVWNLSFSIVT